MTKDIKFNGVELKNRGFFAYLGEGISWILTALAIIILYRGCSLKESIPVILGYGN